MSSRQSPDEQTAVEPTLDGSRVQLQALNLGTGRARGRLKRFLQKLNAFLAGMYVGESCAGTPHSERRRKQPD